MSDNTNQKPLPRKSCGTCTVRAADTNKKPNVQKRLKMTPQNIRDMYTDLLAQEVRRRIRQKIAEDATAIDQIVEEALNGADDYKPLDTTPVATHSDAIANNY